MRHETWIRLSQHLSRFTNRFLKARKQLFSFSSCQQRCELNSRREMLRLGGLLPLGLSLPTMLSRIGTAAPGKPANTRAKSCLLIFMEGGSSHIDLWDMKPHAPAQVRGEFQPIATRTPGITVCEHLPMSAPYWHHLAQVRSVTHAITDHNAGSYYTLTGHNPVDQGRLIVAESPQNFPAYGSVLSALRPSTTELPNFVHVAEIMSNNGHDIPGELAGFLGAAHDPLITGDPSLPGYRTPGLDPQPGLSSNRIQQRESLLQVIDRQLGSAADSRNVERTSEFHRKALSLIASPRVRNAFRLDLEPERVRLRYGVDPGSNRAIEARKFGGLPHLGQSMLLSRRLIEAGVPLVTLVTGRRIDQAWDTHRDHFPLLKKSLLPPFDRAFSALMEDLIQRHLLDETLLVVLTEFGRTPKLGYVTSNAGAAPDGRDHWPSCFTVMFAGAGVTPGLIYGASDSQAAYPSRDRVNPEDIAATIYHRLGISADAELFDNLNRPHRVMLGHPIDLG